jgi:hypothetical protein
MRSRISRFNETVGDTVAGWLSAMWFFWLSVCLAFVSLPAVVTSVDDGLGLHIGLHEIFPGWLIDASLIALVAWVAQTLIQLTALPVLAFQNKRAEAAAAKDTERLMGHAEAAHRQTREILEALDLSVEGGLESVYRVIKQVEARLRVDSR